MKIRSPQRAQRSSQAQPAGGIQLILAKLILVLEHIIQTFAVPLVLGAVFITLSWFGAFAFFYPWAHLVALVIFSTVLFHTLGRAHQKWKPVPPSAAKRRVEEATGLKHRPLDVISDRPFVIGEEQVWQAHQDQAKSQLKNLGWPKWKLSFADRDFFAVRYALLAFLTLSIAFGWGALGDRFIAAINPALGKLRVLDATVDAWITPPEYTHLPPIMIATPAGMRHDKDVLKIPEGSVITAHIVEKDGDAPVLVVNGESTNFTTDDLRDFSAEQTIKSGDHITIKRGWQKIGAWKVEVTKDEPPRITLNDQPVTTARKTIRLFYTAADDFGVASVVAKITPRESVPGVSNEPILLPLTAPDAKQVTRVSFEDLTSHPWAGTAVQIQLVATDGAGHVTETEAIDYTLPERTFMQPVARALIEERKRLLQAPNDEPTRNEAANVMAGIAHQPMNYRGDPVVLMALRSGAVRLVLNHEETGLEPIADLLWQSAIRVEDGATGLAEQSLRRAQQDLAEALDRSAGEEEIQQLIAKLHEALSQYLSELATHIASRPGPVDDLSQVLGPQTNMITPQDLEQMLNNMRNLSATGAHEAARNELSRLQQLLENIRTDKPQFSEAQKLTLQRMLALRALEKQQQLLLDKTFRAQQGKDSKEAAKLGAEQKTLARQLQGLKEGVSGKPQQSLERGTQAMGQASQQMQQGQSATQNQSDAVKSIEEALQGMASDLRASMMQMPLSGMGGMAGMRQGQDPFGRSLGARDDGSVKLPDQMQVRRVQEILNELQRRSGDMSRSRGERDYIERLLQNF